MIFCSCVIVVSLMPAGPPSGSPFRKTNNKCQIKFELLQLKAVSAIPHHLARLADIAELLGKPQQPHLRPDNLFALASYRDLRPAGGRTAVPAPDENRAPPPASVSKTNNDCQVKFKLIHTSEAACSNSLSRF